MTRRDLAVIGGGAGGLVVASVASQLGLKVTLIEKEPALGGDCLHYGCVPSKTLIHTAKVASLIRRGAEFGLSAAQPAVDLGRVHDHVRDVIERIQVHDDPERFRGYGCEVLFGAAEFITPHEVRVNGQTVRARRFVIATGATPMVPPIEGLAQADVLTNRTLFSLRALPARLVVLGGGPIGIEMAQAYARLGSRVTVIERLPEILPREDPEVAGALRALLMGEGVDVFTSTEVTRVHRQNDVRIVTAAQRGRKETLRLEADQILVAAGQRPAVEGLGLEAAGVACDARGIQVDARLRSSQKHIYACGDVCGPYQFTHAAEYQAGIVISNTVFRFPKKADYRLMPWVTYTDPELARVGPTEAEARERGLDPTVLRFQFKDIDRASIEAEPQGFVKLVVHKGKILGASILGPRAGELLHEIVLAIKLGAKIADISATIHAYPTLAQVHRRAVNAWYAGKLFSPGTRRLTKWINRLLP